jgi:hypothetical protein
MYNALAPAAVEPAQQPSRSALKKRLLQAASVFVDEFLAGLDRFPLDGPVRVQSNWVYEDAAIEKPYEFQLALTLLQDGDFE